MDNEAKPTINEFAKAFVTGRRLVVLMVVVSGFTLYSHIIHPSARFHVPDISRPTLKPSVAQG